MSAEMSLRGVLLRPAGEAQAARKITRQIHHFKHISFLIRLPSYLLIITWCHGKSVTTAWTPLTHKCKHDPGSWHKTWGKCRQDSPGHLNTHHQVSFLGVSAEHNTSSSLTDHEAMGPDQEQVERASMCERRVCHGESCGAPFSIAPAPHASPHRRALRCVCSRSGTFRNPFPALEELFSWRPVAWSLICADVHYPLNKRAIGSH